MYGSSEVAASDFFSTAAKSRGAFGCAYEMLSED